MRTIIVVPAYNEEERVGEVVAQITSYADAVFVVDDGSFDRTAEAAERAGAVVLRHAINRGQGAALRTGTDAALLAGADCIVHCDADGQHDPSFLPALLVPIHEGGADVVYGSRFLGITSEGMPFLRSVLLRAAKVFNVVVLGIPHSITDPQSGLRAMTAAAARAIDFRQDRMAHCSEILRIVTRSAVLRWQEVPILVRYTPSSIKKGQRAHDALKIVWQLFVGTK